MHVPVCFYFFLVEYYEVAEIQIYFAYQLNWKLYAIDKVKYFCIVKKKHMTYQIMISILGITIDFN